MKTPGRVSKNKFFSKLFDSRTNNIFHLLIRFNKTLEQLKDEISYKQLFILLYLYNIDSSSNKHTAAALGYDGRTIKDTVYVLSQKELIISKKVGANNYMYITTEGRTLVKNFLALLKKQKSQ